MAWRGASKIEKDVIKFQIYYDALTKILTLVTLVVEIRIFFEVGKLERYLANQSVFRLGLGPVLMDS
jgi:hypothetical protein